MYFFLFFQIKDDLKRASRCAIVN